MILGKKAIELADERQAAYIAEVRAKFPNARLRLSPRHIWAIYAGSGAEYTFRGQYVILDPALGEGESLPSGNT